MIEGPQRDVGGGGGRSDATGHGLRHDASFASSPMVLDTVDRWLLAGGQCGGARSGHAASRTPTQRLPGIACQADGRRVMCNDGERLVTAGMGGVSVSDTARARAQSPVTVRTSLLGHAGALRSRSSLTDA